jgi:uncharacterized protein YifE (UPF0438 family)
MCAGPEYLEIEFELANLLLPYLERLISLENGTISPFGETSFSFVHFCKGLRQPETKYEKAYDKFRRCEPTLKNSIEAWAKENFLSQEIHAKRSFERLISDYRLSSNPKVHKHELQQSATSNTEKFSVEDAKLLEKQIGVLQSLEKGTKVADSPDDTKFVAVCQGLQKATTPKEKAYLRWKKQKPDIIPLTLLMHDKIKKTEHKSKPKHSLVVRPQSNHPKSGNLTGSELDFMSSTPPPIAQKKPRRVVIKNNDAEIAKKYDID